MSTRSTRSATRAAAVSALHTRSSSVGDVCVARASRRRAGAAAAASSATQQQDDETSTALQRTQTLSSSSPSSPPLLSYCLLSSACGVVGAGCIKCALNDDVARGLLARAQLADAPPSWQLVCCVRIAFFALSLAFNSYMLSYFVLAMQRSSSLLATTYSQCCSVLLSALVGAAAFGESAVITNPMWQCGAAVIVLGLLCVRWGNDGAEDERDKAKTS